ncbi:hypothetical protein Fmac_028062 [Flemingia macrophylla]|uniref:Uncharacterized protein n=1 Tax=Flemingia macrophylla TaxID=520843 RepID=A0ABD1LJH6_9FABA
MHVRKVKHHILSSCMYFSQNLYGTNLYFFEHLLHDVKSVLDEFVIGHVLRNQILNLTKN